MYRLYWAKSALGACLGIVLVMPTSSMAQARADGVASTRPVDTTNVLSEAQARQVDQSIDRALAWIASKQRSDGSFPTLDRGQPAVTSLCVLAFLSRGHAPGEGKYGNQLDKAVRYVVSCQHKDGLITLMRTKGGQPMKVAKAMAYNHPISGLMLSEVFGQVSGEISQRIRPAIESALNNTLKTFPSPKRHPDDKGGWRYYRRHRSCDSDLSITSWALMFLRSSKNAGFDVPPEIIDEALAFIRRTYDERGNQFWYALRGSDRVTTRGMTGAGILSLSLGGQHQTKAARRAGDWILAHPFNKYLGVVGQQDRFFYSAFYCSHAMFQLGGRYWKEFYPVLCNTLITHQHSDGCWDPDAPHDAAFGNVYSTAMAVLALSPPYQLLPIFQR